MVQLISTVSIIALVSLSAGAFSPTFISHSSSKNVVPSSNPTAAGPTAFRRTMITLSSAEADDDAKSAVFDELPEVEKGNAEENEEEEGSDEGTSTSVEEEAEEVEASSTKEDEVLAKYRSAISSLEATLRSKRNSISDVKESASRYSKNGTLRLVAELADYKKSRARSKASDEARGKARKIDPFLPILDELTALKGTFPEDAEKVSTQFASLGGDLLSNLEAIGLKSFGAEAGTDRYLISRHTAIRKEYSDIIPEGYIMEVLVEGLEVEGNIVREAEVVVSLGVEKEVVEEDAKEEEEAVEDEKEAKEEVEEKFDENTVEKE